MAVKLLVKQRGEAGGASTSSEVVVDTDPTVFGREKECQVPLTQKAVSRNHARITRDGALFFLEDLGSSYGTKLNGEALPKREKRLLRDGDLIAIAQYDITFERVEEEKKEGQTAEKTS